VDNASVNCSRTVEFISTAPVDMLLSASPQTMASQDVNSYQTAEMRAKVIDVKGNAVKGQPVQFSLSAIQTTGTDPTLRSTSAVTDEYGYATVLFEPGAFPKSYQNATGRCNITAVWTYEGISVTHTLPLIWMNYPYLSVATSVDPETVNVTGTVDVTLTLTGDGYKLQQRPVDVMLVMDTSGSMAWDDSGHDPSWYETSRLDEAQAAAKDFVGQMNLQKNDRIGVVEFASDANVVRDLTGNQDLVESTIDSFRAGGATNMREALYLAIKELKEDGRSDAVKAVILMSDGEWNYEGTPLAMGTGWKEGYTFSGNRLEPDNYRYYDGLGGTLQGAGQWWCYYYKASWWGGGSWRYAAVPGADDPNDKPAVEEVKRLLGIDNIDEDNIYWKRTGRTAVCTDGQFTNQNMSIYASSNDVRLYTIGFASDLSAVEPYLTLLSQSANGNYTWAGNEEELKEVYAAIAGELKTEAGVNTTMDILFENVEVNGILVDGRDVLEYVYAPGESTVIESWIDNETGHYQVIPFHTEDQTPGPDDDLNLHFDIGTVHIGQTWTATYRLKVLAPGNIKLFGDGSTISFNNGTETLNLPDTFVTAVPDLNNTGIGTGYLWVGQPSRIGSGAITDFLQVTWNLNYTGDNTTTQRLFYSTDEKKTWVQFYTVDPQTRTDGVKSEEAALDVRDLPAAQYWIRVKAEAPDAAPAENETSVFFVVGGNSTKKIKLI